MSCSSNDDTLTIRAQDNPDKVTLMFESKNHEKLCNYELRLMNLDQEHLGIPDTDYSCVISMPSSEFSKICKDLSQFGESVNISCSKEGVKFSVSGGSEAANIKFAHSGENKDEAVNIEMHESVTLTFAIRYLNLFCKATPLSKKVTLMMAANVPLVVHYEIDNDIGYIKYYLAPKLDDEES